MDKLEELVIRLLAVLDVNGRDERHALEWAKEYLPFAKGQLHYGDCTNAPISCHRCIYAEYMAKARVFAALSTRVGLDESR